MLRRRTTRAASPPPTPPPAPPPAPPAPPARRLFAAQVRVLLWKDAMLRRRRWLRSLGLLLLLPVLLPALIAVAQRTIRAATSSSSSSPDATAAAWTLEGLRPCVPRPAAAVPCITLAYTPHNAATDRIMALFNDKNAERTGHALAMHAAAVDQDFVPTQPMGIVPFKSEADLLGLARRTPEAMRLGVALAIQGAHHHYRVYYNMTEQANMTVLPFASELSLRDTQLDDPLGSAILALMRGLDEAMVTAAEPARPADFDLALQAFPDLAGRAQYAGNTEIIWSFAAMLLFLPGSLISIALLITVAREKEHKLRQNMELMGLNPNAYWLAHLVSGGVRVLLQSLVLCLAGVALRLSFFANANFVVVLALFVTYGLAMLSLAFFLSTLVTTVREAAVAGFALAVVTLLYQLLAPGFWYTMYVDLDKSRLGEAQRGETLGWVVGMFFPFFNFSQLYIDLLAKTAGANDPVTGEFRAGIGFALSDLLEAPRVGGAAYPGLVPLPLTSFAWMLMDMLVFAVLGWYLDHVVPNDQGYRRPLLFFLQPGYWRGWDATHAQSLADQHASSQVLADPDPDLERERAHALDPTHSALVRIVNLCKTYSAAFFRGVRKAAVKHLFLTVGDGELLVLLGQNGAGKSTTMSMLYGTTHITSGDASLFGLRASCAMGDVRKRLGVCVQHDCLFASLTAAEHVYLYAGIKGYPAAQRARLADSLLHELRLHEHANVPVGEYSGGMKRRLSLLLATLGNPKLLILDEPTAGMDPVTRRYVWDFVRRLKQGRAVLLSTHSLEEADRVGDRIAVMSRGRLIAIGTSMHIKRRYGGGYRLTLSVQTHKDALLRIIARLLPTARLTDEAELRVRFRLAGDDKERLAGLLKYLEDNPHGLLASWSMSQTTLEDIFLTLMQM